MKVDPYLPMEAALAQPAPEEEPSAPIHVGPVTLKSLFVAWGRVLKKHFWWGVALMVLPTLASKAAVLLPAFGISTKSMELIAGTPPSWVQKATGDPTDPTDPTDRSDPQEVLA